MDKKILFFDCFSGISGDMAIGALLDLGVSEDLLLDNLKLLGLEDYQLQIKKKTEQGLAGTDFTVLLKQKNTHQHSHHSRNLKDILQILEKSKLNKNIKALSAKIFTVLAEAEARVHGKKVSEIHLHEVGALDSIVDIVGTAICIDCIGVDEIIASPVNTGSGFVQCAHGILPVPAPATLEILKGIPVYAGTEKKELTTPTGAAILKTLCASFTEIPALIVEQSGYGLGKHKLLQPNMLRVILGRQATPKSLWMLETNIDNMNPEIYSWLFSILFEKGALDVFLTPIIMKKNRPAVKLSLLCSREKLALLEDTVFRETPTLGIRKYEVLREELRREEKKLKTPYGIVSVKVAYLGQLVLKYAPEYEDCKIIAEKNRLPLQKVYAEITALAGKELGSE